MLPPACLSTHDGLISLGHILAAQRANKPERETVQPHCSRTCAENHQQQPPWFPGSSRNQNPAPAQLDGAADCWPTPESEISSLFSLMQEKMQNLTESQALCKVLAVRRRWLACGGVLPLRDWLERGPALGGDPAHTSLCLSPSSASTCSEAWGETFPCHLLIHHSSVGWASTNQDPPLNLTPSLLH